MKRWIAAACLVLAACASEPSAPELRSRPLPAQQGGVLMTISWEKDGTGQSASSVTQVTVKQANATSPGNPPVLVLEYSAEGVEHIQSGVQNVLIEQQ